MKKICLSITTLCFLLSMQTQAVLTTINQGEILRGEGPVDDLLNDGKLFPGDDTEANRFAVFQVTGDYLPTGFGGEICFNVNPSEATQIDIGGDAFLVNTVGRILPFAARYKGVEHPIIFIGGTQTGSLSGPVGLPPLLRGSFQNLSDGQPFVQLNIDEVPLNTALQNLNPNSNQTGIAEALQRARESNLAFDADGEPEDFDRLLGELNVVAEGNLIEAIDRMNNNGFVLQELKAFGLVLPNEHLAWGLNAGLSLLDLAVPFRPNYFQALHRDNPSANIFAQKGFELREAAFKRNKALTDSTFHEAALKLEDRLGVHQRDHGRHEIKQNPGHGHLWFQGFGNRADGNRTFHRLGYSAKTSGVMMGFDYQVYADLLLGIGGGYSHTGVDIGVDIQHIDTKTPFGSFWAIYNWGCTDLEAGFTYQKAMNKSKRRVIVANFFSTPRSKYDGYDLLPHFAVAYNMWVSDALHIRPVFAVDLIYSHSDAAREFGGGGANLNSNSYNASSLQTRLGLGFDRRLCLSHGVVAPSLDFAYVNVAQLKRPTLRSHFAAFPSATFAATTRKENRSYFDLGAGISQEWHSGANFSLRYQGRYGEREKSHTALVSIGKKF